MLGETIGENVRNKIRYFDLQGIMRITSRLVEKEKDILYCAIADADNSILFHTDEKRLTGTINEIYGDEIINVTSRMPIKITKIYDETSRQWIMNIAILLESKSQKQGIVLIGYSLKSLEQQMREEVKKSVLIYFFLTLIGLAVAIYVSMRIVRPILHLAEISKRVKEGDFEAKASIRLFPG